MSELEAELAAAGGALAPPSATARLRALLAKRLDAGRRELAKPRSGYGERVLVAFAAADGRLLAVAPAEAAVAADAAAGGERTRSLLSAVVGALAELAEAAPAATPGDLRIEAGDVQGHLLLALPGGCDPVDLGDLVALCFEEHAEPVDRLRATAVAVPAALLGDAPERLRPPIGDTHPLRVDEAIARLGGHPADPRSRDALEDSVLAMLGTGAGARRPHDDPDAARRAARRILQRLDGMGKWGGYHTEFAHLARGFAGNDRALAQEVGEALLSAGLLAEKPSVGQRHVFLNPRRAGDIRRLIDDGAAPADLRLPSPRVTGG